MTDPDNELRFHGPLNTSPGVVLVVKRGFEDGAIRLTVNGSANFTIGQYAFESGELIYRLGSTHDATHPHLNSAKSMFPPDRVSLEAFFGDDDYATHIRHMTATHALQACVHGGNLAVVPALLADGADPCGVAIHDAAHLGGHVPLLVYAAMNNHQLLSALIPYAGNLDAPAGAVEGVIQLYPHGIGSELEAVRPASIQQPPPTSAFVCNRRVHARGLHNGLTAVQAVCFNWDSDASAVALRHLLRAGASYWSSHLVAFFLGGRMYASADCLTFDVKHDRDALIDKFVSVLAEYGYDLTESDHSALASPRACFDAFRAALVRQMPDMRGRMKPSAEPGVLAAARRARLEAAVAKARARFDAHSDAIAKARYENPLVRSAVASLMSCGPRRP